jgi:Replication-relaxation
MGSSETHGGIDLQHRDFAVLRGLLESRLMTLAHASALHFDGKAEMAKKRVQKLKAAGFIAERRRRVYEPSVLSLTRKAFAALSEGGHLADLPQLSWANLEKRAQVSELTVRHELAVMDVKAALATAVNTASRFSLAEFSTWPALYEFRACPGPGVPDVLLKPDGFIRIRETEDDGGLSEHTFFLEVDRSTETQAALGMKAACYVDYYRRGGLAERFGHRASEYRDFPFRVLMVLRNTERRNNAAEQMLRNSVPVQSQVWLTTMDQLLPDPLGPVWATPRDYASVTGATPFAPASGPSDIYRRRSEREDFVEPRITKRRLLDSA